MRKLLNIIGENAKFILVQLLKKQKIEKISFF